MEHFLLENIFFEKHYLDIIEQVLINDKQHFVK